MMFGIMQPLLPLDSQFCPFLRLIELELRRRQPHIFNVFNDYENTALETLKSKLVEALGWNFHVRKAGTL